MVTATHYSMTLPLSFYGLHGGKPKPRAGTNSSEPNDFGFHAPHASQQQVLDEAARYNVLDCGRRYGKTDMLETLVAETALQGQPAAYLTPIYPMAEEVYNTLSYKLDRVITRRVQGHRLELSTGGVIDIWSMDGGADRMRGRRYRRVCLDEVAMRADLLAIWERVVRPTLIDFEGDAWFASTPRRGGGFEELFKRGKTDPEWRSWQLPTHLNPHIPPAELVKAKEEMSEQAYRVEILAEFDAADSDLVYELNRAVTLRSAPEPWEATRWKVAGIDPGGGDPTAIVTLGVSRDQQRIHQYHEFYRKGDVTIEHLAEFLTRYGPFDIVAVGETGGNVITNSLYRLGYNAQKADMRRGEGIEHVRWLLGNGRLTIEPSLNHSIAEFGHYRWAKKRDGATGEEFATSTPDWMHADLMDARRYAAMAIWNGVPNTSAVRPRMNLGTPQRRVGVR